MKRTGTPPSKLFIRSEVLAVIDSLTAVENTPKEDKVKQVKRLRKIEDQGAVLLILTKELQRASTLPTLQTIAELLMELGTIDTLHDPLWEIIRNPESTDEVKDTANLILRHLGDESDPELYLEYLEDPLGLINRETARMLEVSAENPEALIDFIDFIFSLPLKEQCNLLSSLQTDYAPEYLVNIYIPALQADPPKEIQRILLKNLGETRSKRAGVFLHDVLLEGYYADDEELTRIIKRSLNELKLAGAYREDELEETRAGLRNTHTMTEHSKLYKCFATLPDGIGNQGLVISRVKENGDIAMMSVAVNDLHGVIDCFGFYQLTETDFNRIMEKFHEESIKIPVPETYCLQKLDAAEKMNRKYHFRIPYEYACWKVLLDDVTPHEIDPVAMAVEWANPRWLDQTANLYQHPDFQTWFLEEEDHPSVTEILRDLQQQFQAFKTQPEALKDKRHFLARMEMYAEAITTSLMEGAWKECLVSRLADTAYLLHQQNVQTFSSLAATEVMKLTADSESSETGYTGFIRQYGRRCIEEFLLRYKLNVDCTPEMAGLIDYVLKEWDV